MGAHWFPERGLGPDVPSDPLIYRLYEGMSLAGAGFDALDVSLTWFPVNSGARVWVSAEGRHPREVWRRHHERHQLQRHRRKGDPLGSPIGAVGVARGLS